MALSCAMRSDGKPPRRPVTPVIPIERAFDELRFGAARTLNLRDSLPTVAQAEARLEAWLRQRQAEGGGEVLVVTGRGLGSLDGVGRVREAVLTRCRRLKRLNVVADAREHGPGAVVVTVLPLRAVINAPRLRTGRKTPVQLGEPGELSALPDDIRAILREVALLSIQRLGVLNPGESTIADEMRWQFGVLSSGVADSADLTGALRSVAVTLLRDLREE